MECCVRPGRLAIGDFSLYFERVGSGPPLVFLHGLGGNHLSWWQQVPYFMRWFECVTLDQRGFGLSPDPDGRFNQAHPDDLARLLDHLRIEKAVLVGQSMGGWTIVGCALDNPDRVAALVMAGTPGGIFTPGMAPHLPSARPTALLDDDPPPVGSLPTYARDYFLRLPQFAYLYDQLRIFGARPPADATARIIGRSYDLAAVRSKLTMPVLCLAGEQDVLIPPAVVAELCKFLPNARMVTIPDCGHSTYFECPEIFNQAVFDFLRSIGYAPLAAT